MKPNPIRIVVTNRKAFHEYDVGEKWEAGIVLTGTEVKSVRGGKVNLSDGWVDIDHNEEAILRDVHISPYSHGNIMNHMEKRSRKLLLKKAQIIKLTHLLEAKGLSLIPIQVYFKGQLVKIEIALAKGKKHHDKREAERSKDAGREMARALRDKGRRQDSD